MIQFCQKTEEEEETIRKAAIRAGQGRTDTHNQKLTKINGSEI